ncbi:hypothetical protein SISSUDRAFT_992300 [Sistotremastrum suecicum HHB10207 ss-3]|uniref:K Homology domain-containing protein n=1 Tax=Sistotremastrum suecicum HHB10207 ss-3 TaxID=1314776 RepID=A0A165Z9D6_9AGAM|nr:hypothetical protein SISSUDRAFT_992300 [Sistotremastrum suecicum HHB10207 ss-3]
MSKRKWDQQAPDAGNDAPVSKVSKTEDGGKTATDAAAAAAAIAAKIAAQFSGPGDTEVNLIGGKDPHDGDFIEDVDINDVRNRYLLTKGSTQQQINEETGASVSTKGVWYPDRSRATEKDPPLYLHISAASRQAIEAAKAKIQELINVDMGSLVEEKKDMRRERRKWPEAKLTVGLESIRNFNVRAKVVGPQGVFVKHIQQETGTRVQIKGLGSGFIEQETGRESDEPMHIHITGPDEQQVSRARILTEDLLEVVRAEHAKTYVIVQQQQAELQQLQGPYGAYSGYAVRRFQGYAPPPSGAPPPPPPGDAPPPPPGEAPPPPPSGAPNTNGASNGAGVPPSSSDVDAYTQYWAAYGYDVNSAQFKEWQASQQAQYAQYYATYGAQGAQGAGGQAPPPPAHAPEGAPPPPPPPAPSA